MNMIIYKCTKCGAITQFPELVDIDIDESERCMFCGGMLERKN